MVERQMYNYICELRRRTYDVGPTWYSYVVGPTYLDGCLRFRLQRTVKIIIIR